MNEHEIILDALRLASSAMLTAAENATVEWSASYHHRAHVFDNLLRFIEDNDLHVLLVKNTDNTVKTWADTVEKVLRFIEDEDRVPLTKKRK